MEHTIETEEFYELMQAYRHAPLTPQTIVCKAYRDVINHIDLQNARLIAAAPELLDLAKQVSALSMSDAYHNDSVKYIVKLALNAIAKAEGKE
jgi:hypothetical protein